MANEVIRLLDQARDYRPLSEAEFWLRGQLKRKVRGLASLQRTIARQHSRIQWLREGEANTDFFQSFASARRRNNQIFRLKAGEGEATTPDEMDNLAVGHFVDLLGTPRARAHYKYNYV